MRKPEFGICKIKDAYQLCSNSNSMLLAFFCGWRVSGLVQSSKYRFSLVAHICEICFMTSYLAVYLVLKWNDLTLADMPWIARGRH